MQNVPLEEFADKLNEIIPVLMRELLSRQENELCKGTITLQQFLVLQFLHKEPLIKMTSLAGYMQVTTAAMTGIVDRLVRGDYVERILDPDDRRVIKIKMTPKGAQILKKINDQRRQMILRTFSQISPDDRKDYLRILMRVKEIVAEDREERT